MLTALAGIVATAVLFDSRRRRWRFAPCSACRSARRTSPPKSTLRCTLTRRPQPNQLPRALPPRSAKSPPHLRLRPMPPQCTRTALIGPRAVLAATLKGLAWRPSSRLVLAQGAHNAAAGAPHHRSGGAGAHPRTDGPACPGAGDGRHRRYRARRRGDPEPPAQHVGAQRHPQLAIPGGPALQRAQHFADPYQYWYGATHARRRLLGCVCLVTHVEGASGGIRGLHSAVATDYAHQLVLSCLTMLVNELAARLELVRNRPVGSPPPRQPAVAET